MDVGTRMDGYDAVCRCLLTDELAEEIGCHGSRCWTGSFTILGTGVLVLSISMEIVPWLEIISTVSLVFTSLGFSLERGLTGSSGDWLKPLKWSPNCFDSLSMSLSAISSIEAIKGLLLCHCIVDSALFTNLKSFVILMKNFFCNLRFKTFCYKID